MMHVSTLIGSLILVSFLMGCGSKPQAPVTIVDQQSRVASSSSAVTGIEVSYTNERGAVKIMIDPSDEDVYLDFRSSPKAPTAPQAAKPATMDAETQALMSSLRSTTTSSVKPDTVLLRDTIKVDSLVWSDMQGVEAQNAQKVVRLIQQAQESVYRKDFETARQQLDESIKILPTAEAFALLGTVSYVKGNKVAARHFWQKSLSLKPDQEKVQRALGSLGGQ